MCTCEKLKAAAALLEGGMGYSGVLFVSVCGGAGFVGVSLGFLEDPLKTNLNLGILSQIPLIPRMHTRPIPHVS